MSDSIERATPVRRAARKVSKRKLATQLSKQLRGKTYAANLGKRVSREEFLARMLVELATNMETQAIDGTPIRVTDYKDWVETVKFIHNHLDGPAQSEANFTGVNIFKVYAGIDTDKV